MNVQIRFARQNDYESVIRIMSQVQDMHVEWRPDIYKPNENLIPEDVFEKIIENGTFYVAESEGVVVGILEIVFRHIESPSQVTRDVIFIDSMAIDEKYRGMGIGHQMFDFLKKLKKEKNLDGIELQVNARNSAAYEMYKKYGFTEKSINMELLD
jgi:ribosomal protein S18 acetylase RimI-like enzyme